MENYNEMLFGFSPNLFHLMDQHFRQNTENMFGILEP